jgi:soluble P-type ATPase
MGGVKNPYRGQDRGGLMIEVDIPGYGKIELEHLVMDYNGTLACDGHVIEGVKDRLDRLSEKLSIHVLTADTFGKVAGALEESPCHISILPLTDQAEGKRDYVEKLGKERTVSIGNGRNDRLMLKASALGIAVILEEGIAVETMTAADVVFTDILSALDLLTNPLRLTATLRS